MIIRKVPSSGVGVNRTGCFAEYLSIPVTNAWYADPGIPLEQLACFDPLGNATHTALSFDVLGEDVLITGAGPIGLMAAAIARHAGARYVVMTDVIPYRLELARKMGVTDINKVYTTEELAAGDVMFAATGVTNGDFLKGVRYFAGGAETHSIVMRYVSRTVRYIEARHYFDTKPMY